MKSKRLREIEPPATSYYNHRLWNQIGYLILFLVFYIKTVNRDYPLNRIIIRSITTAIPQKNVLFAWHTYLVTLNTRELLVTFCRTRDRKLQTLPKNTLSPIADVGRILAVSAIFYFHIGVNTHFPLSQYGHYGVGFFIVLAGVAYLCFSRMHVADLRTHFQYFTNRVWALFLIFLIVNLMIFASSYIYPSGLGRPFTAIELLLSSLGVSHFFGYRFLSVVMWFVPFILQVYLLLPLVAGAMSRIHPLIVLILGFLLSYILIVPICISYPEKAGEICSTWSPIFRLPEVILGVFLGIALSGRSTMQMIASFLAVYAIMSFCLFESSRIYAIPQSVLALPLGGMILGVLITIMAVILFASLSRSIHLCNFRLLGNASYPFFLIHGVAINFIYARYGANAFVWLAYFLLCWCGAVLLTILDRQLRPT